MVITLEKRTAETVKIYFEKANKQEIKQFLPQKAKTVEEALEDYKKLNYQMQVALDKLYM